MCHTQTTSRHQTVNAIVLSSHWNLSIVDGWLARIHIYDGNHASSRLPACEHLHMLLLNCSSRHAAVRLLQSRCCDREICVASWGLRVVLWLFLQQPQRGLHRAYTFLQHMRFGAACLRSVMLASNDKERAVSLMLRTLLRTFVRILVHLYPTCSYIHSVVVTQHFVTQLRLSASSLFHSQDVL